MRGRLAPGGSSSASPRARRPRRTHGNQRVRTRPAMPTAARRHRRWPASCSWRRRSCRARTQRAGARYRSWQDPVYPVSGSHRSRNYLYRTQGCWICAGEDRLTASSKVAGKAAGYLDGIPAWVIPFGPISGPFVGKVGCPREARGTPEMAITEALASDRAWTGWEERQESGRPFTQVSVGPRGSTSR